MVEEKCRTTILLNDMDISIFMGNAQQIEEAKIRKIKKEGKGPGFDESSQPIPKSRFYHQESSMWNKDRVFNKNF